MKKILLLSLILSIISLHCMNDNNQPQPKEWHPITQALFDKKIYLIKEEQTRTEIGSNTKLPKKWGYRLLFQPLADKRKDYNVSSELIYLHTWQKLYSISDTVVGPEVGKSRDAMTKFLKDVCDRMPKKKWGTWHECPIIHVKNYDLSYPDEMYTINFLNEFKEHEQTIIKQLQESPDDTFGYESEYNYDESE